jgi:hypothetical protein
VVWRVPGWGRAVVQVLSGLVWAVAAVGLERRVSVAGLESERAGTGAVGRVVGQSAGPGGSHRVLSLAVRWLRVR